MLGYSQSAIIASLEMRNLMNPLLNPMPPAANQLGFTLLGDPMNPNGGLLARFPGLSLPSLGLDFYGATPPDTPYPTNIYTLQYDGFASFPRYPLNFISDLNAFLGIQTIHGRYPSLDINALPPGYDVVTLPGSNALTGVGQTNYYMITHPDLPILSPIKSIPIIGGPLYSLLEPDMRILVNLGYGDPHFGYSTGPANVPTPFGVFPDVNPFEVGGMLVAGAQQGAGAFVADISGMTPVGRKHPGHLDVVPRIGRRRRDELAGRGADHRQRRNSCHTERQHDCHNCDNECVGERLRGAASDSRHRERACDHNAVVRLQPFPRRHRADNRRRPPRRIRLCDRRSLGCGYGDRHPGRLDSN